MIVCLIAEGSYPYITGGVSSWIQQLITECPDINFKLLSIMPDYKKDLDIQYNLPKNLIDIKTIYLNDFLKERYAKGYIKGKTLSEKEKDILFDLVSMNPMGNFYDIYKILNNKELFPRSIDFLSSDIFWQYSKEVYNKYFEDEKFNEFFWTFRSMFVPIINMFQIKSLKADIYHSVSTGYAGFLGAIFNYQNKKKYILTEHGIYPREREEEILKSSWVPGKYKKLWIDYFYFISKLSYQSVDEIITLFDNNSKIQKEIGAPEDRLMVIPNGVDLNRLEFYEKKWPKDEKFIIGAVLRVTPIKDVMTLIRAFKVVKLTYPKAILNIIGPTDEDPDYFEQCKGLVELLDLKDSINFTGRTQVIPYYKEMDVLVLTSISEGQPLVILEAMAIGIPMVATNVGSCKELISPDNIDKPCGIITNLVAPSETAEAIIKIISNEDLAKKMALNGRRRVEKRYRKKDFIDRYRRMYLKYR